MSEAIPLSPLETKIRTHALLVSIGFLIFLPLGTLTARYLRTYTNRWWFGHSTINFVISAPLIFAGWALGHQATTESLIGHFNDRHKQIGLALLVLYLFQLTLGAFIHFIRIPFLFVGHRPPQNYFHAILGLAILALAAYEVHYGYTTEWPTITGNVHPVPESAKHAWLALIIVSTGFDVPYMTYVNDSMDRYSGRYMGWGSCFCVASISRRAKDGC
ncbi:hypothetical protein BV25DRAFT_1795970 [Artomyces pyxidatus]|uniref:Uncharacterized protein n=1 Tax=Artomyces pyxidatus TaxID=48021 RepID=A0ACB8TEY8_9AGAM|nr:hypothetical protein BV25DRAFT_1795970 [Artomyces pyxidatus]